MRRAGVSPRTLARRRAHGNGPRTVLGRWYASRSVSQRSSSPSTGATVLRGTRRRPVTAALVAAMFMAAIEGTIVATAMPSIVGSLGGFALYGWVFAGYLLMQAVATPLFGRAADLVGRKPVFVAGVAIFLAGSVACGFAPSMPWLIAFRLVQGFGAGAVQPVVSTLAGDLYAFRERARIQGLLSSVWGLSAVVGPLAGGLIVTWTDWAWIFWANVPLGLVAIALVVAFLKEEVRRDVRSIDLPGVALFLAGASALLLAATRFSEQPAAWTAGLVAFAVVTLTAFVRHELRADDAMMPMDLWRDRLIATAHGAAFAAGMVMIVVISYLPTYAQGVLGTSALVAGFTLTTMSIGWPIAATASGLLMVRFGVRRIVQAGGATLLTGAALFLLLDRVRDAWFAAGASLVVGLGMGLVVTTSLVAVQTRVAWSRRGAATAANALMRILGNAIGAALAGGIVNSALRARLGREEGPVDLDAVTRLLEAGGDVATAALSAAATEGLATGLHRAFAAMVVCAVAALTFAAAMPDLRDEDLARDAARD